MEADLEYLFRFGEAAALKQSVCTPEGKVSFTRLLSSEAQQISIASIFSLLKAVAVARVVPPPEGVPPSEGVHQESSTEGRLHGQSVLMPSVW